MALVLFLVANRFFMAAQFKQFRKGEGANAIEVCFVFKNSDRYSVQFSFIPHLYNRPLRTLEQVF
jgi:hypothetical protein